MSRGLVRVLTPESATTLDICFNASSWFFASSVPHSLGDSWVAAAALVTKACLDLAADLMGTWNCLVELQCCGRTFMTAVFRDTGNT